MGRGEPGVKRLDAERGGVLLEPSGAHQRQSAEPPNVAVMEVAAVVQCKADRRVRRLVVGERTATEQQGAGEARLHDDVISGVEVEHDELRAAPRTHEGATMRALA